MKTVIASIHGKNKHHFYIQKTTANTPTTACSKYTTHQQQNRTIPEYNKNSDSEDDPLVQA